MHKRCVISPYLSLYLFFCPCGVNLPAERKNDRVPLHTYYVGNLVRGLVGLRRVLAGRYHQEPRSHLHKQNEKKRKEYRNYYRTPHPLRGRSKTVFHSSGNRGGTAGTH